MGNPIIYILFYEFNKSSLIKKKVTKMFEDAYKTALMRILAYIIHTKFNDQLYFDRHELLNAENLEHMLIRTETPNGFYLFTKKEGGLESGREENGPSD